MPPPIPRLFLIFCALCAVLGGAARAERKPPPFVGTAPPQPVELNVKVRREGKTEIPLRIHGKANEPVKFLIRVPPVHGHLSDPRPTDREAAVVVYEPPADLAITTDKFFYAAQGAIGVSAAVAVSVTIVDQPPQLAIQDTLDFSTVRVGASNFRMLEISNRGGLIATGEVIVDAPWKIEGKTGYRLRAGDLAIFKVIFAPIAGGKFEGVARFTSDPEHSTTLRGVAQAAVTANPAQWTLQQIPGDATRSGSFELINQLDEPQTIQLRTDAPLKIPSQVTIPARGKATISVEAPSENAQAVETEIHLAASDFSTTVPVSVPRLNAVLRTTTPAVAFGRITVGQNASAPFELENIGGVPGHVSWEISAPFRVSKNLATLMPGEKKAFSITLDGKTPGRYRTWLQFKSGAQTFDLPVQGEVVAVQRPATAAATAQAGVAAAAREDSLTSPEPVETATLDQTVPIPPEWSADLKLPKGVSVSNITPTSAVIEWPAALSQATRFRVDMRQLEIGFRGELNVSWVHPTGIPIETRGANYAAILTDLQPGQPWTVRIMSLEANGDGGDRLFAIDFYTPPKTTLMTRLRGYSLKTWLLASLAVLFAWWIWQRWQNRASA